MNSNDNNKRKRNDSNSDLNDKGGSKALVVRNDNQLVGNKITLPSLPKQVLSTPKFTFKAIIRNPLSFGHEAFEGKKIESGPGVKWHRFSNISFPSNKDKPEESEQLRDKYVKETGLTPIKTRQDWGLGSSVMYRSRRGSISGFSELDNGGIQGWRMHSLPTSEALSNDPSSSNEFLESFNSSAKIMRILSVNTKNKPQTVNTILSDVGKVQFDDNSRNFKFVDSTHAMGVSGKGLDKKKSESSEKFYQPSIEVAKMDGKKGTASQTYHSEPMALTLHNQYRKVEMENDKQIVGMFASFPNQVCYDCGRMFEEKTGDDSVISGVPGREFKGQKPGEIFNEVRKNTVIRATPMKELIDSKENVSELRNLYKYHKK